MCDITIRKINHSFIRVDSDQDIALELSEAFRFEVPGAKYSPQFKMGRWDGFIRLFNVGSRLIPSGLFKKLIEFIEQRNYSFEVINDSDYTGYEPPDYETPDVTFSSISEYMESMNLHARGEPLVIRDYQIYGAMVALRFRQGILNAATGSGKSLILYTISRYITEELDGRVLIIVPTVGLTTQLKSDFKDYSSRNSYDVEENVHSVSSGIEKTTKKRITISTFQSLKGLPPEFFNSFTAIISDEGHKIQSESFKAIYEKATEVPYRLACTGTVHETKCHILSMQALTGPVYDVANAKDLIEAEQLVPLKIKAISLNYSPDVCKSFKKAEYDEELDWIITNPKRNNFIKKLALNCKGTTLVFFRYAVQGLELYKLISELSGDRKVFYIDKDTKKEERESIRKIADVEDVIIVCSYGTMSAGVNAPSVAHMIIAHPIKSRITFLQSIGRGLRLSVGKLFCMLYDIGDSLVYKSHVNHTYRHFGERLKMLTQEGHEFDIINLDF